MLLGTDAWSDGLGPIQRRIQREIDTGRTPDEVEANVVRRNAQGLSEEQQAALWLYAWSYAEQRPVLVEPGGQLLPLD